MQPDNTSKSCKRCLAEKPLGDYYPMPHVKKDGRDYYCKECRKFLAREKHAASRDRHNEYSRNYYRQHAERERQKQVRHRQKLRDAALLVYGGPEPKCACCGESILMFLTIDHVHNDGAEHRKRLGQDSGNMTFLRWLRDNSYPEGFQLLCFNCNIGKHHNGGTCPHETVAP